MKEIAVVKHENILKTNLKDKKHLNLKGVKMFAYNLKSAYFGNSSRNRNSNDTNTSRQHNTQFSNKNTWNNNSNNTWNNHYMDFPIVTAFNSNLSPASYNHRNKATHKPKMADNGNPMIPPQMIELIKFLNRYISN